MLEQRFGESTPWSLGVEEELLIVDAQSFEPVSASDHFVEDGLKRELFACVVETNTGVCETANDAFERLKALRLRAAEIARARGLAIAAIGSHPTAIPEQLEIANEPRYHEFVSYAGVSARRQGVNGLHVHVGMPSADECVRAIERILPWLPLVLALSTNSPYFKGEATGLASNRAEILAQLPRSGAPPPCGSYASWEKLVENWIEIGLMSDYTMAWWDVRPHPRFGTLEIRMPDQPTDAALAGAFIALLQALPVAVLRADGDDRASRADYAQNRWAALRFGPRARLVHGKRLVEVAELTAELLDLVRPVARELGSDSLLEALDPSGCEGDRQLELGRERGLAAVTADAVERTVAFADR